MKRSDRRWHLSLPSGRIPYLSLSGRNAADVHHDVRTANVTLDVSGKGTFNWQTVPCNLKWRESDLIFAARWRFSIRPTTKRWLFVGWIVRCAAIRQFRIRVSPGLPPQSTPDAAALAVLFCPMKGHHADAAPAITAFAVSEYAYRVHDDAGAKNMFPDGRRQLALPPCWPEAPR